MQSQPKTDGMVFRSTNAHKGRKTVVTPQNSTMMHLSYGRIILDSGVASASFKTSTSEVSLICLSGSCTLGPYCGDSITNGPEACDNGSNNAQYGQSGCAPA